MTKPDSGSPDQGANQDDAVWLDLVARLEEGSGAGGVAGTGDSAGDNGATGAPSPSATFRDFDPLGLAGAAPTELSAAERLASAPAAGDGGDSEGSGQPGSVTGGPRDYEAEDDDGAFVPEEPPSLAGTDPLTMLAWLGAVGAPVALVLSAMFWRSAPVLAVVGMVAVFVLAVVYLVMKLPQEKDENDDGARV
ncbi:hypothetical protein [Arthrobacter sp. HMWF013]|uniref:hypothetical protein n=1 Tax=Arthrobacter sp. HMWF013 TaxID=2056849 RepID=UPI000D38F9AE|nr:hypothetical protein [Arthrobacter sp. HMWF013]PTT65893.1 hypothetical protein DBR22_11670 [Arthrobacter sp. HMWF013]